MIRWLGWLGVALLIGHSADAGPRRDTPPPGLVTGEPARGASLDAVIARVAFDRLMCKFSEDKRVALLARPLKSTGMIYFDRAKGVVRQASTPKAGEVVVTKDAVRIRDGRRVETIPLAKSRELRAFATVFPTVLRGDRAELESSFEIGLFGSERGWWALAFTPRSEALRAMITRVLVFGHGTDIVSLQVSEASGDRTDTRLFDVAVNGAVSDAVIASAFGDT